MKLVLVDRKLRSKPNCCQRCACAIAGFCVLITFVFFIYIVSWDKTQQGYLQLVWNSNMPDDLYDFFNQEDIKTNYKINKHLNPFYLRGDFNGDKKLITH